MTIEMIKAMFDACYLAGRTRAMLPALPEGVTSSYIHYLDVIDSLERQGLRVRVSDIGEKLDIPRPGVTRTVKEMENRGYLRKMASEEDGRVVYITATEAGKQFCLSCAAACGYFGRGRSECHSNDRKDAPRDEREEGAP